MGQIIATDLTMTKGGNVNDQQEVSVTISPGIFKRITILFPAGHAGLTYVRIMHEDRQILPTNLGQFFRGDNLLHDFRPDIDLTTGGTILKLLGYNTDTIYPHTVYAWIEIGDPPLSPLQSVLRPLGF